MPAKIKLYDYQRDAVDSVLASYRGGMRRPAISAATGSGKTIMFSKVIEESGERSLVIAHRKEIVEQAAQKIGYMIDPTDIGIVMAERNQADHPIVVASIQTIADPRRLARLGRFGLVVVDEAHHANSPSWMNTLRMLGVSNTGPTKALGASATWDRADGLGFEDVFDQIVYSIGIEQLIGSGHLADITAMLIETELDTSGVRSSHGDFNTEQLSQKIVDSNYADTLAAAVAAHARDRISLVFAPNVRTADLYRDALIDVGINAASVNGETPRSEREQVLADLRAGRIQAVVNCGIYTEGTDIPIVNCVVLGRPTQSRALFQQMVGRGLRNYPGKDNCLILDVSGASQRNSLQSVATLFGREPDVNRKKVASVRDWLAEEPATQAGFGGEVEDLTTVGGAFVQKAKPIEMLDRKKIAWIQIDNGAFSVPIGEYGQIVLRDNDRGLFDVIQFGRDSREVVGHDLDIGYAQGIAEQLVIEAGARTLVNPKAAWRRNKSARATEKQLNALHKWNVAFDAETITKVEASDLLSKAIAQANLRRSA